MTTGICCFSHRVLTRAERDAVARLREQRAEGRVPRSAAHTAATDRMDPIVTFYHHHMQHKPNLALQEQHQRQKQRRAKPPTPPVPPSLTSASGTLLLGNKHHHPHHHHARQLQWLNNNRGHKHSPSQDSESEVPSSSTSLSSSSCSTSPSTSPTPSPPVSNTLIAHPATNGPCFSSSPQLLRLEATKLIRSRNKEHGRDQPKTETGKLGALHHSSSKLGALTAGSGKSRLKEIDKPGTSSNGGNKLISDIGNNTFISAAAHTAMRRATDVTGSNSPTNINRTNRVKEGTSVLLDTLKTWGSRHRHHLSAKEDADDDSEGEDENGKNNEGEKTDITHTIGRLTSAGRRKLSKVRHKLAGAGRHPFTFSSGAKDDSALVDSRPDMSDILAESHNDAYFQEIMRGD